MNDVIPRYEFRTFAQEFGLVTDKLRRRSSCTEITEGVEIYLVQRDSNSHNIKVRGDKLEIKQLLDRHGYLQQWKPVVSEPFPLTMEFILENLAPLLGTKQLGFQRNRNEFLLPELLDELSRPPISVGIASVFKRRFRFEFMDCPAEIDEVLVNGAKILSVAIESEDDALATRAIHQLGLTQYENVQYPLAIQRILGLAPLPKEAWYGRVERPLA
jgi:hypothetical protein